MEPEERQMLERLLRLSESNNRILRRLHRYHLIGRFIHLFYWLVILGVSIAIYFFIKPYLNNLTALLDLIGHNPLMPR